MKLENPFSQKNGAVYKSKISKLNINNLKDINKFYLTCKLIMYSEIKTDYLNTN